MVASLRIGFNARLFSSEKVRGFTRHSLSLIQALREGEPSPEFHLFSDQRIHSAHHGALEGCLFHERPFRPSIFWEQAALPAQITRARLDVFHSTVNIGIPAVPMPGVRKVITVHDLITHDGFDWSRIKTATDLKAKLRFELSWQATLTADAIITVSRYTADRLIERYPSLEDRVHVVHNGVHPGFSSGNADPAVLKKHRLQGNYFLYVGGFEERKNIGALIEAFERFSNAPDPKVPMQLALVGPRQQLPEALARKISAHPSILLLDYVSDSDLLHLYRGARAVVVPSKEEGFGFQLIEAMACGTPVLSSNATSLPEVGGDAVAYFDPLQPEQLAALLQKASTETAWLDDLKTLGLKRVQEFTWKKAGEATMEIYRS